MTSCGGSDNSGSSPEGAQSAAEIVGEPRGGAFDLLTYNVAGLPEGISGSHPATNTGLIAPLLNDYDVVLMQETWKTPDPNPLAPTRVYHEILEAGSKHAHKTESAPLPLGKDASRSSALVADGLNVFSEFALSDLQREAWPDCEGIGTTHGGDCLAFKGFAAMTIELAPRVEVLLVDTHLEAGGSERDSALRQVDLDAIASYVETHAGSRAVIVGGDMNLHTSADEPIDSEQYRTFVDRLGLTDSCEAVSCPEGDHIDKVMIRNGEDVKLSIESWEAPVERFQTSAGDDLSDHPPIHVRIGWTAAD